MNPLRYTYIKIKLCYTLPTVEGITKNGGLKMSRYEIKSLKSKLAKLKKQVRFNPDNRILRGKLRDITLIYNRTVRQTNKQS